LYSFLWGDAMKVTIPEIPDRELADILIHSGMAEEQIKAFLKQCENHCCCTEKVRILRTVRKSLLDTIHKKQAVLDKLDYIIWCTEHKGDE